MPEAFAPSQLDYRAAEFKDLTGEPLINHIAHPTPSTTRWAFSDAYVALTYPEALDHADKMIREVHIERRNKGLKPNDLFSAKDGHDV